MTTKPAKVERENIVPFRPLSMLEEMEHMFENFLPHSWMRGSRLDSALHAENMPQVDVLDQDENIIVRAALPGVNKKDLEVSSTDHTVSIRCRTKKEVEEEKGEFYRREICTGSFLRTVTLPAIVDESRIQACFKDGLLEITLPKQENSKRHSIKIDS